MPFVNQNKMLENKANLLVTLNIGDLQQLIEEAVKGELEIFKNFLQVNDKDSEKDSNELLTRLEASNILKVSYTTLFHWNNKGILPAQKLGNRVYYEKCRIMEQLNLL